MTERSSQPNSVKDYVDKAAAWDAIAKKNEQITMLVKALRNIAIHGCGMLSQPPAMNGPEESWPRMRIAEYERCARDALAALENQS